MKIVKEIFLLVFCLGLSSVVWAGSSPIKWNEDKGQNFIIYSHDVPQDFVDTVM